jgi:hypothetical protein
MRRKTRPLRGVAPEGPSFRDYSRSCVRVHEREIGFVLHLTATDARSHLDFSGALAAFDPSVVPCRQNYLGCLAR